MGFSTTSFHYTSLRAALTVVFITVIMAAKAQVLTTVGPEMPKVNCNTITFPGKISGDQIIRKGDTPDLLFETDPATGGTTGELRYMWMEYLQIGSFPGQWYPILSATSSSYQPGPMNTSRKFMRCVSRQGCNNWVESNTITITVSDISL